MFSEPLGWRHDSQAGESGKQAPLFPEIRLGTIPEIPCRVLEPLRTAITLRFPLFTSGTLKIDAVAGKGPTVMQRPDHRFPELSQTIKQNTNMEAVSMQIV